MAGGRQRVVGPDVPNPDTGWVPRSGRKVFGRVPCLPTGCSPREPTEGFTSSARTENLPSPVRPSVRPAPGIEGVPKKAKWGGSTVSTPLYIP